MQILIFSRDRAMQLDLLIRSLYVNCLFPFRVCVMWSASAPEFEAGYQHLWTKYPDLEAIPDARVDTIAGLLRRLSRDNRQDLTMLLVDDAVLRLPIAPHDEPHQQLLASPQVEAISTRLATHITQSYAYQDHPTPPPVILSSVFRWADKPGCWGYPASLDGTIYSTERLLRRVGDCPESKPNQFEYWWSCHTERMRPLLACWAERSRVIGIPHNRVQTVFNNRCQQGSAAELNAAYLAGQQLSLRWLRYIQNQATHVPLDYRFEPQLTQAI